MDEARTCRLWFSKGAWTASCVIQALNDQEAKELANDILRINKGWTFDRWEWVADDETSVRVAHEPHILEDSAQEPA